MALGSGQRAAKFGPRDRIINARNVDLQCGCELEPQYFSLSPNSHAAETEDGSLVRVYACGS
jgi:hypothetical protein